MTATEWIAQRRALLDAMQARCDAHVDAMDGREDRWFMDLVNDSIRLIAAVRAVLELHYPEPYAQGPDYCAECEHRYPCPTVTAITTALGADDE